MFTPPSNAPPAPAPNLQPSGRQTAQARPATRQFTALLVDDNEVNLEVGCAILEELGLRVHVAHDGREAVEKVSSALFDLVLMDLQMPRLDGLDATREIRALPGTAALPVIAMTANAFEHSRAACMDAGMNDFLTKPIDISTLAVTLSRWLPPTT